MGHGLRGAAQSGDPEAELRGRGLRERRRRSGDNPTVGTVTTHPAPRTVTTHPAITRTVTTHPVTTDNPTIGNSAPAGPSAALHGAIDHLVIPKIKLDKYVVQGVQENDLEQGPGHYPQTVLPGQDGNAAIAGHRTTYGAPFYQLNELSAGDDIYLTDTSGEEFTYKVSEPAQVVSPSDSAVLDPTSFPELTLTTCNPRFSATSRLVIVARLTGQPPLPAPKPAAVTQPTAGPLAAGPLAAVDNLGSGNQAGWFPAVGFGALVVLLWVAVRIVISRTRRWNRVGACFGGIAICLVPLWFCFENVVRLLPQNI